ncbi:MAG: polymerase, sigma 54 subunit, RpoN, partial [Bacteroidetes bacterium]|nr:polymerase, sigma 54 subunit, RpoN [Bacteroidota bacterium]
MLNISLQHKMMMKLSPQQVQYLKMLQLPTLALEQKIKAELEMNPLLEEGMDEETDLQNQEQETAADEQAEQKAEDDYTIDDYMNDDLAGYKAKESFDSEEREELPIADAVPLHHGLSQQFTLLDLDDEEILLGQEIIGNVDEDGYLRREIATIVQDLNLTHGTAITVEKAEQVLKKIQRLDPVGIASRSLQECLTVQLEALRVDPELKALAHRIVSDFYDDFTMRHFEEIAKKLGITLDELKRVLEVIQHLNPKPGEG